MTTEATLFPELDDRQRGLIRRVFAIKKTSSAKPKKPLLRSLTKLDRKPFEFSWSSRQSPRNLVWTSLRLRTTCRQCYGWISGAPS
jgi:hypothetical protein